LRGVEIGLARKLKSKIEQVRLIGFFKPCDQKKRAKGSDCGNRYVPLQGDPGRHGLCERAPDVGAREAAQAGDSGREHVDDDRFQLRILAIK